MRRFAAALLLVALHPCRLHADEIVLVSGGRLSCEILEEGENQLRIRLPHGTMVVPRARIAEIVREGQGAYLRREARASLRAGSTAHAVELFERAFRAEPDDAETRRGLVAALMEHARWLREHALDLAAARATLQRLAELAPDDADAAALLERIAEDEHAAAELYAQARQAYDDGDLAGALRLLEAWRLRRPAHDEKARAQLANAHIEAGNRAGANGDLREALDHFRTAASFGAADRVARALFILQPIAVLEELKDGETGRAKRLIDGIAAYPDPAVPIFLRAVLHHARGEVEEAVTAYADAARRAESRPKPTEGLPYEDLRTYAAATMRAVISQPPQEGSRRWRDTFLGPLRHETSEHFEVYAPTEAQAKEAARVVDEAYERIAEELLGGLPAAARGEVVVHASAQAYVAADPIPEGSPLAAAVTLARSATRGVAYDTVDGDGKPIVRVEAYAGNPELLADTLPHEIVHVVQRRGLDTFRRGHWFDEGLAMLYESTAGRRRRADQLRRADSWFSLPELLALESTPPGKADLFYNQAHSLAAFLRERGSPGDWRRFLATFRDEPLDRAVADVYHISSLAELERLWRAEARAQ